MLSTKNIEQEILEKDKKLLRKLNKKKFVTFKDLPARTYYDAIIVLEDGIEEKHRFIKEDNKHLFIYAKGRRRYGFIYKVPGALRGLEIKGFIIDNLTKAEKYLKDFLRYRDYFIKNALPGLWDDIRQNIHKSANADIESFLNDKSITSFFEAWEKSEQYGLFKIEGYKTGTLDNCYFDDSTIEQIKKAIKNKENFDFCNGSINYGKYDCAVFGEKGDDGIYRVCLNKEYKGTMSGYYYILINYNHALIKNNN